MTINRKDEGNEILFNKKSKFFLVTTYYRFENVRYNIRNRKHIAFKPQP